jgi:HD-like signal output (HDOD) protein
MSVSDLREFASETRDSLEFAAALLKGVRLPPQPTVVASISTELAKEHPDFRTISRLLEQDPAMVSKVLQTINSPLFSLRREVTSIRTALSMLGLKNFYSMVVTSAVQDALGFKGREAEELWAHSLHVAKLCEEIAGQVGWVSSEEAYLVGLFHDGAVPVLVTKFPLYKEIVERVVAVGGDIASIEEEKFNTHHAVVGGLLARSWGLPPHIYKTIRFHHADSLSIFGEDKKTLSLAAVLMLSDYLSRCVYSNGECEDCHSERWNNLQAEIENALNIDFEIVVSFREKALELHEIAA